MTNFRRFAVLYALLFWQGGFLFYASIVVPIGTDELGALRQGFITRRVAQNLNLAGVIVLALLVTELWPPEPARRQFARALLWLGMALAQGALFVFHARLSHLLNLDEKTVIDHAAFRTEHKIYLWISTVQWALAVGFLLLTPGAWSARDRRRR
jgi:hypothetical protein